MSFSVIIPAAGSGARSGREIPKQYVEILGRPVLAHTIQAFTRMEGCEEIVVAIDEAWREVAEGCRGATGIVRFVSGGAERQHSIANALAALGRGAGIILVHDAARPCVPPALIRRVVEAAERFGAAIPVMPLNETVKRVDSQGVVLETLPRSELRAAQTPQGFRRELLVAAYENAAAHGLLGTDDASLVEARGARVHTVEGAWQNIKITVPEDFQRAEEGLRGMVRE